MKTCNSTQRQCVSNFNNNNLYPFKKLYKGMKVMVIKKLYFKFGLINETIGMVHEIVMDDYIKEKNQLS